MSLLASFLRAVFWLIIGVLLVLYLAYTDDITVYWSTSKNECQRIEVNGEMVSCKELINYTKYNKVWVK